jgi:hypothetical protein
MAHRASMHFAQTVGLSEEIILQIYAQAKPFIHTLFTFAAVTMIGCQGYNIERTISEDIPGPNIEHTISDDIPGPNIEYTISDDIPGSISGTGCAKRGPMNATFLVSLSGFNIVGVVTDPVGNLYLADQAMARIIKIDVNGQVVELVTGVNELGVGISELQLIGSDLYFAEANTGAIFTIDLTGSFPVAYSSLTPFIQSAFNDPGGLTSDSAGNLYISSVESDTALGYHSKIDSIGNLVDLNWSTLEGNWPTLTVDEQDNIYTVEPDSISQTTPAQVTSTVISGLVDPVGLTYQNRCLYFTDTDGVKQYDLNANTTTFLFAHTDVGVMMPEPTRILVDGHPRFYYMSTNTIWLLQ